MNHPAHHRISRQSLIGIAAMLITVAMPICARAAVSQGPSYTNAALAEQSRNTEFYRAEQSYQEKLKVGRERYDQKQINRAKIIGAMSAELQARQQTVVIQPVADAPATTDEPVSGFPPALTVVLLAFGFIGAVYFLKRAKPASDARLLTGKTAFVFYKLD